MRQKRTIVDLLRVASFVGIVAVGESCPKNGGPEQPTQEPPRQTLSFEEVFLGYQLPKSPLRNLKLGDIVNVNTDDIIVSVEDCYGRDANFGRNVTTPPVGEFDVELGKGAEVNIGFFALAQANMSLDTKYSATYSALQQLEMTGVEQLFLPQACRKKVKDYVHSHPDGTPFLRQIDGVITGNYALNEVHDFEAGMEVDLKVELGGKTYVKNTVGQTVTNAPVLVSYSESEEDIVPSECSSPDTRWRTAEYNGHCYSFFAGNAGEDVNRPFALAQDLCETTSHYQLPVVEENGEYDFLITQMRRIDMENAWINLECNVPTQLQTGADLANYCHWKGTGNNKQLDRSVAQTWYNPNPAADVGSLNGALYVIHTNPGKPDDVEKTFLRVSGAQVPRRVMCEEK